MEIKIKEAQPKDADQIQNLYYKVWLDTYTNEKVGITKEKLNQRFSNLLTKESIDWLENFIDLELPENNRYLVAEESEKIVGIIYLEKESDHNRIQGLYILPKYQNKGLGKKLWNEAKRFLNLENETIIEVAEYNTKAIEFYKKLGFVDTGKRFLENTSSEIVKRPMLEMVLNPEVKN